MRFLMLIVQVSKGIYRGIRLEVKKLTKQTRLNELKKQKVEELEVEWKRLGEYVYYNRQIGTDERVGVLSHTIGQLLLEIEQCEQELRDE